MTYPKAPTTLNESLETPLERVNTILIRYPRFNDLQSKIQLCEEASKISGEPQCMLLEGGSGAGKSTLVRTYAQTFPRFETQTATKIPVFYLETPSPVTVKGMAACFLEALGDPGAQRGTLWSMNSRLVHFIHTCDVRLVILDDFHHLIDRETNRVLETVSDWLKVLIKETGVPFLVVGLEGTARRILESNPQLSRLFAIRETLIPFRWDMQKPETIQEFSTFVTFAEKWIGFPFEKRQERQEFLRQLFLATDGVVGNIMNLLRFAVMLAVRQNTGVVTQDILSQAFDLRLREHTGKPNPFTAKTSGTPDPVHDPNYDVKGSLSVSDVLTTRS